MFVTTFRVFSSVFFFSLSQLCNFRGFVILLFLGSIVFFCKKLWFKHQTRNVVTVHLVGGVVFKALALLCFEILLFGNI